MEAESVKELIAALERSYKEKEAYLKRGIELSNKKCESDEVDKIGTALLTAQGEFPSLTKTSKAYNYMYCPLEDILSTVRPVLKKNGLGLRQFTDESLVLYTRVFHTSGQWFESRIKLREMEITDNKKSAEQAYGSSQTYMRRYQICSLLGIQPEAEDDEQALSRSSFKNSSSFTSK